MGEPTPPAVQLADAIKRIAAADDGQMAERLDVYMRGGSPGERDAFAAICGVSLPELLEQINGKWPIKKNA